MMALRVESSGEVSSCLISFSGICNSRKRLIIGAVFTLRPSSAVLA